MLVTMSLYSILLILWPSFAIFHSISRLVWVDIHTEIARNYQNITFLTGIFRHYKSRVQIIIQNKFARFARSMTLFELISAYCVLALFVASIHA